MPWCLLLIRPKTSLRSVCCSWGRSSGLAAASSPWLPLRRLLPTPPTRRLGRIGCTGLGCGPCLCPEQGVQRLSAHGRFPLDLVGRLSGPGRQVALASFLLDVAVDGLPDGVGQ